MTLLDSDHLTVLYSEASMRRDRLVERMAMCLDPELGTTIVNFEERLRGWLASIAKERIITRQIRPYAELGELVQFFGEFFIAPFDGAAVNYFESNKRIRIGSMDLKIASIALANHALLVTANRRDFEKVPGLRFENWLD